MMMSVRVAVALDNDAIRSLPLPVLTPLRNRLSKARVVDRMPALKPQSSANNASYVAAGRQLSSG